MVRTGHCVFVNTHAAARGILRHVPTEKFFKDVLRLFLGHFYAINTAKIFQSNEDIAALLQVKTGAPCLVKTDGTAMAISHVGKWTLVRFL